MSEWISVKDKFPEDLEEVLCFNSKPNTGVRHTRYMQCSRRKGLWWHTESVNVENITHWMPLPNPPKET